MLILMHLTFKPGGCSSQFGTINPAHASTQKLVSMFNDPLLDDTNIGKCLTIVAEELIREDNVKHCVVMAKKLGEGGDQKNE